MSFNLITCIVERGKADRIVDEALKAGATAATMYYARGRGIKEKLGILGRLIAPEKEVILIVTKKDQTDNIFNTISIAAQLDVPGKGFAYVQPVEKIAGALL
ncbi:MAG: P-II family nitrogen regulator [Elusimicrobia bacterium]|nr:P-II family nitrogen regulator [Candidatus Liberimonas magnetica]